MSEPTSTPAQVSNEVRACRCSLFRHPHDPAEHVPDPDYGFGACDDARDDVLAERGITIYKLARIIREKRRQIRGRDRGLMYWRRWAEARFFNGERRGGTDAQVRERIDVMLGAASRETSDAGHRQDADCAGSGVPRTVNGEARDNESSVDLLACRALIEQWRTKATNDARFAESDDPFMRVRYEALVLGQTECADDLDALLTTLETRENEERKGDSNMTKPDLDLFPEVKLSDVTRPSWFDIERLAAYEPAARYAVSTVAMRQCTREEALVVAVFMLYELKRAQVQAELDRRNTQAVDFIIVDGKRYVREP